MISFVRIYSQHDYIVNAAFNRPHINFYILPNYIYNSQKSPTLASVEVTQTLLLEKLRHWFGQRIF